LVVATVRSIDPLQEPAVEDIAAALRSRLGRPVTLEIVTLPVVRSQE
jgi:F0F1-type ATP synthase delta subunit